MAFKIVFKWFCLVYEALNIFEEDKKAAFLLLYTYICTLYGYVDG